MNNVNNNKHKDQMKPVYIENPARANLGKLWQGSFAHPSNQSPPLVSHEDRPLSR